MAAGAANEMGFTNLKVFQGGMPEWISKGYPVTSGHEPGNLK